MAGNPDTISRSTWPFPAHMCWHHAALHCPAFHLVHMHRCVHSVFTLMLVSDLDGVVDFHFYCVGLCVSFTALGSAPCCNAFFLPSCTFLSRAATIATRYLAVRRQFKSPGRCLVFLFLFYLFLLLLLVLRPRGCTRDLCRPLRGTHRTTACYI